MKTELSTPTLRWSSDEGRERFAYRVIYFINPKFEDANEENPHSEFNLAKNAVIEFSQRCDLTANEFMLAMDLCHRGQLMLNDAPVKLFREIDRLKLGEVEQAYKAYKKQNKQYELGKEKVKNFLNPPKELTEEEKKAERLKFFAKQWEVLHKGEGVDANFLLYDLVMAGVEKVNLDFVEKTLSMYSRQATNNQLKKGAGMMSNFVNIDALVFFKNEVVRKVIIKEKLKDLSKDEWIKYWENKRQKAEKLRGSVER